MPKNPSSSTPTPAPGHVSVKKTGCLVLFSFVAMFILGSIYSIDRSGIEEAQESSRMQTARTINLLLFQYASDHGGNYPQGKSSTEIFQQLIDQKYATDPSVFYFRMAGKTAATSNRLKPENVCWDVTNAVLPGDSDLLPTVFATGYKIDYVPGGKAHPLGKPDLPGLGVAYKGNNATFLFLDPDGAIQHVLTGFDPKGRTYQQLTPDGPLK